MSQSVVINLGSGDLHDGFPRVTAQLWTGSRPLPEQFIGSLPAAPALVELYRNWQSIYQNLYARKQLLSRLELKEDDDELEIDAGGITNVSAGSFDELCQKLKESLNAWLKSFEFLNIDQQLRSQLHPAEEIQVIIETNDVWLRRLPWHRWDFFQDYPLAEMALSRPEYKRSRRSQPKVLTKKVRILAILSSSKGIDLETEVRFLNSLQDAEIVFLVNPSRQEFNTQLWNKTGWHILFFAGHSHTEGETGRIYINENKTNNSLTIEQLEEALKAAIDNGLHLAIFNSCDGLGLANALEKLNIPTVIVMREPVPNLVAQDFFKHFLAAFAVERLPLYLAVQQARRKLQGLEDDFPGASWLPAICHNPAVEPPTWLKIGGIPPCPYRGLFAFREEDAPLFKGRDKFTQDLVAAVKTKPLVAVVGPSGSGKSSVVFAGLIPRLKEEMQGFTPPQVICFRPGNNPFETLATAIAPLLLPPQATTQKWEGEEKNRWGDQEIARLQDRKNRRFIPTPDYPSTPLQKLLSHNQSLQSKATSSEDENARRLVEQELAIAFRQDDAALYKIIESLVQQQSCPHLVLIADQFEELYTLCPEEEKEPFLDILLSAVRLAPAFTLVLTMRADFYGYALSYRPFSDALQGAIHNLGPMSREELRSAIEEPAAQMQVRLENDLTNLLVNAVEGQPGCLPLLEFALTTLWAKQRDGWLTHQAYSEIGGVESAIANHAEAVYAQLSEADRQRAQRVFMQLVHLGESQATRRLATRDEVKEKNWDLATRLASSRLVVTNRNQYTGEEAVEIVHEALIKSWERLEHWIIVDAEFRRWQEQLRAARHQWESSGKDEGALLRGKPLADAEYWQQKRLDELSSADNSFIQLSLALREQELKKQKRQWQHTICWLSSGLVGALILAGVAWWQWRNAAKSEIQAISTSSAALFASDDRLDALIEAIRAKQKLQKLGWVDASTQAQVESALRLAVYGAGEYNRLSGHSSGVNRVLFSPDGQTMASASDDNTIKLWKRDGTLLRTLKGHTNEVWGVAFSPDGKMIASASDDKTIKLWKLDGTLLKTLRGHSDEVEAVAFSPDGKEIASASEDKTVKLWKLDGTLLTTLRGHSNEVEAVAFSPDGQMIVSASDDKTVKLWKLDGTLLKTLRGHSDEVEAVAFSPDGKAIASAGDDKTIKLWKLDGNLLKTLSGHTAGIERVAFSPDGQIIASASVDKTVKLWKLDGTLLRTLAGHSDAVYGVGFSPDGKTIASAGDDKTVKLWKLDNTLLKTLSDHKDEVVGIAISPDGQMIASASDDKTIKLWKLDGTLLATLKGHSDKIWGVAFSPDGQTIASASLDKTVKLWRRDGTLLRTFSGHSSGVKSVAFSPDGQTIASASLDKTVKLWRRDGRLLHTFSGHTDIVSGVAFSPDGQAIALASEDNTVKLWQLDGTLLRTLKGHTDEVCGVAFSPDGQTIVSASDDKTIKLWKLDGTELATLSGHSAGVNEVAFSPDGKTIVSASEDKTIKLWKLDGTELATLSGHSAGVNAVTFSPDGKVIASASADKTTILWNLDRVLDLNKLLVYGCDWTRDYLKTNPDVGESDRRLCNQIGLQ